MINEMFVKENGLKIISKEKNGRCSWYILENGTKISSSKLRKKHSILIKCHECGCLKEISLYGGTIYSPLVRKHICFSCQYKGEGNPFYGKKHSQEFKNKLSKDRTGIPLGPKKLINGFNQWDSYTKEKQEEIKNKIRIKTTGSKNHFWGKKHPLEIQKIINKKIKNGENLYPNLIE